MATIARLSVDLIANSAQFRKDLDKATKHSDRSFKRMANKAGRAGRAFAAAGAAAAGAFALTAVKEMGNFQEALSDVQAKTEASRKQIDKLGMSMRNAAKQTKFTATQTAEAGTFLAQAGLNITEINKALLPTLDLAASTKTSVQNTADFMTNIMKGMGMTAEELERAADVLATTTAKSNTNLTDLATAMSYAAPSARAMGMEIEETSALLGSMANAGIKGSMAGTALRRTFSALAKGSKTLDKALLDTDVSLSEQQGTLKKLGVSARTTDGKIRNLKAVLMDLKAAGGTEEDMITIFGDRAGTAMMQFMNDGLIGAEALETKLQGATGAAERMAAVQMNNLNGDMLLLNSQFKELQLIFADGGLYDFGRKMTKSLTMFMASIEPKIEWLGQNLKRVGLGFAGLIAPIVLTRMATFGAFLWNLRKFITPVGLAITALSVGLGLLGLNFTSVVDAIKRAVNNLGVTFKVLGLRLQTDMIKFVDGVKPILNILWAPLLMLINGFKLLKSLMPGGGQFVPFKFTVDVAESEAKLAALEERITKVKESIQVAPTPTDAATGGTEEEGAGSPEEEAAIEKQKAMEDTWKSHFKKLQEQGKTHAAAIKATEQSSLAALVYQQTSGSKKMAAITKAAALRDIAIAGQVALARAWASAAFPANIPAVLKAGIATAIQVQNVQGQFHDGIDDVPNTGTYLLEQGERVVDNRLNKDLTQFLASNGSTTTTNSPTINFNVNGGDEEGVERVLREKRGEFESMLRNIYNENAQNAPF